MLKLRLNKITGIIFPIFCIILWESISYYQRIIVGNETTFVVSITEILKALLFLFINKTIYSYLFSTIWRTAIAFLFSIFIGVFFGFLVGLSNRFSKLFSASFDGFRSIPPIALLPMFILFFGIDDLFKICFVIFGGLWPIYVNTYSAAKSIDPIQIKVGRNLELSNINMFMKITLPLSLPGIFAGLKISLSLSLILSIVCEMLTGNSGLGWFLNYTKRNFDYDQMYAVIIIIGFLGWLLNYLFLELDRKALKWHYLSREI